MSEKNRMDILFVAQDNLSKEIEKMRSNVKKMGKDVADYKAIQDRAFKEKAELQLDMRKAKQDLKDLAKLERDGTEESKKNYISKQKEINEMSEGMKRYNQVINEANKAEKDLTKTKSRNDNNPNSPNSPGVGNLGAELVKAGMAKELGQSVGNATNAYITSAYGERVGNRVGTIGGGALAGAAVGSVIPGIGTALGAGVGAIKGAIDVATEEKKRADGYFQDEVKNIYTQVSELNAKTLAGGIELASNREMDLIAFKNILGSEEKSEKYVTDMEQFASVTPFGQQELLDLGKGMMVYDFQQEEIIPELTKLGDAFAALGVDKQGKESSITAIGRMKSSEKTDLKNINVLQSHGIDAIGILAEKMEVSKQKVYEMIGKGAINGADTAKLIIDTVGAEYEGAMKEFQQTTEGLSNTLEDVMARGDRAEGDGYNNERKKGLELEIKFYEEMATKDREYMGEYKATLKNKEEELMRSTITVAKESQEYKEAMAEGDGAKLGELLADAQTKAMVEWQNSPEMQKLHEAELARTKATQDYIRDNGEYVKFGQDMAEQFNRGWSSKIKLDANVELQKNTDTSKGIGDVRRGHRYATGGRISDDYTPIIADKNERVLTANQNLEYERNRGKAGSGMINNINVKVAGSSASADDIANIVVTKITQAMENTA